MTDADPTTAIRRTPVPTQALQPQPVSKEIPAATPSTDRDAIRARVAARASGAPAPVTTAEAAAPVKTEAGPLPITHIASPMYGSPLTPAAAPEAGTVPLTKTAPTRVLSMGERVREWLMNAEEKLRQQSDESELALLRWGYAALASLMALTARLFQPRPEQPRPAPKPAPAPKAPEYTHATPIHTRPEVSSWGTARIEKRIELEQSKVTPSMEAFHRSASMLAESRRLEKEHEAHHDEQARRVAQEQRLKREINELHHIDRQNGTQNAEIAAIIANHTGPFASSFETAKSQIEAINRQEDERKVTLRRAAEQTTVPKTEVA